MNIVKVLKSFDIFNSEAIQYLKKKAINIFLIETSTLDDNGVAFSSDEDSININVVNRPKTYNLLISAKRRLEEKKQKNRQAAKI